MYCGLTSVVDKKIYSGVFDCTGIGAAVYKDKTTEDSSRRETQVGSFLDCIGGVWMLPDPVWLDRGAVPPQG